MENVSKYIEDFLSFLKDCSESYRIAEEEEFEQNNITQDILHSIELQDHNYYEYAAISKELKSVRKKRRNAKDTMSIIAPVISWISQNEKTIKSLENLLGTVRKAERSTENRIYTPRIQNK